MKSFSVAPSGSHVRIALLACAAVVAGGAVHRPASAQHAAPTPPEAERESRAHLGQSTFAELLVRVPDVVGRDPDQAAAQLQANHLAYHASGPPAVSGRRVGGQDPPADALVTPGTEVLLVIRLTVPDLEGMDCAAATARANEYGFASVDCAPALRAVRGAREGRVLAQSPLAGALVAAPVPITVRIAPAVVVPPPPPPRTPMPVAIVALLVTILGGGVAWLSRRRRRRSASSRGAARVTLRAEADPHPAVSVHGARADAPPPAVALRVVRDPGAVFVHRA